MSPTRLQAFADRLNRDPGPLLTLLTLLFLGLVLQPMQKILWHDELFTFYIASAPSLDAMRNAIVRIDWQPPLIFLTARLSQHLFGVNEFATRLPSTLAFYLAGIGAVLVLKPRVGALWAAVPVLLFWFSFYFKYAAEARPYALLTAFFVLSTHCYLRLTDSDAPARRSWYLVGLFAGNLGMMLSHILAPFSMMPFGAAELVRAWRTRRIDPPIWFGILAPLAASALYLPMVHSFQHNLFPPLFQASFKKMAVFYAKALRYVWPELLLGAIAAVALRPRAQESPQFPLVHKALAGALLIVPILVNLVMMRTQGAFWERYCICAALAIYVSCALLLGRIARWSATAGLAVFTTVFLTGLGQTAYQYQPLPPLHNIEAIGPSLPLVDASGLAFLEMDHYESPALLQRLYYLTDRDSAVRYAHATLFEDFAGIHKYFPLRAHVRPYAEFTHQHKHFLVFGTPQNVEDWLFAKLKDDGATVRSLTNVVTPYRDYEVFDVTLP